MAKRTKPITFGVFVRDDGAPPASTREIVAGLRLEAIHIPLSQKLFEKFSSWENWNSPTSI